MRKKITYLILFLLLVIFTFLGFKMGLKPEVFGDASQIIINETIKETAAINSVTAIVFDFRGYDTLGESIVLFTAICGVAAVLRPEKKAKEDK
ncbi:hydrogen gas-evolving membrane-bound hydrogenase subunit E [Clostridium cuniculi]|uniref:hydrogen gas-evolving membrane-bound hydrogenase subunit E n=1 Tax=Clostridium cuniculi TaxID=2548455 RepID=UPI0010550F93|nr:hydrogen gas-evolving membrane-bound hydrogenase subunit E [Clostridium cuniculi]